MWNRLAVETYHTFPVNWQLFQSLRHRERVFDSPRATRHRFLDKERFTLGIKVLQAKTQCEIVQGNLSLEVKNEIERRFQRWDLQIDHHP